MHWNKIYERIIYCYALATTPYKKKKNHERTSSVASYTPPSKHSCILASIQSSWVPACGIQFREGQVTSTSISRGADNSRSARAQPIDLPCKAVFPTWFHMASYWTHALPGTCAAAFDFILVFILDIRRYPKNYCLLSNISNKRRNFTFTTHLPSKLLHPSLPPKKKS